MDVLDFVELIQPFLAQQQFMTVRDWPFGSAISFIMMALMLLAVMVYFRTLDTADKIE